MRVSIFPSRCLDCPVAARLKHGARCLYFLDRDEEIDLALDIEDMAAMACAVAENCGNPMDLMVEIVDNEIQISLCPAEH